MAVVTFDGAQREIIINAGVVLVDVVVDLYSDWKEWLLLSDNAKYPPAFRSTGGDPISGTAKIGAYIFLQNALDPLSEHPGGLGWHILAAGVSREITIEGNLYPEDPDRPMVSPTEGATVTYFFERSSLTQQVGAADPADMAAAVWNSSRATYQAVGSFGEAASLAAATTVVVEKIMRGAKGYEDVDVGGGVIERRFRVYDPDAPQPPTAGFILLVDQPSYDKDGNLPEFQGTGPVAVGKSVV